LKIGLVYCDVGVGVGVGLEPCGLDNITDLLQDLLYNKSNTTAERVAGK